MLFNVVMSVVHKLILQKIGFHHNTEVISYADEVVFVVRLDRKHEISIGNSFVQKLEMKLFGLGLRLNVAKTQALLVSSKQQTRQERPEESVGRRSRRCRRTYYSFFSALYGTYGLNCKSRMILYKATFEPIVDYCSLAYSTALSKESFSKLMK